MKLVPFKNCINQELYNMYQDIPKKELGSTNPFFELEYNEFKKLCEMYIKNETIIDEKLGTTISRYILIDKDRYIGEVGIRTTLNDFYINRGSQIYYKIRKSERQKGYGNIILELVLKEVKKLGWDRVRINCNDKNIPSKCVILKNGGIVDIESYKTEEGYSSSYIISLK